MNNIMALADKLHESYPDLPKAQLKDIVSDVFMTTRKMAKEQPNGVRINGFGTFRFKTTKARMGRNPKTGESIPVPEMTKMVFKEPRFLARESE